MIYLTMVKSQVEHLQKNAIKKLEKNGVVGGWWDVPPYLQNIEDLKTYYLENYDVVLNVVEKWGEKND